jgi:hypothetical protein
VAEIHHVCAKTTDEAGISSTNLKSQTRNCLGMGWLPRQRSNGKSGIDLAFRIQKAPLE